MTISIQVSVNGNYKVPITTQYGEVEPETVVITGKGNGVPFVHYIPYYHSNNPGNIVKIAVGPEELDVD